MLVPIKKKEIDKLIPTVATGSQFGFALGNPQKILQRLMISSIGGVITLLISQTLVTSQFYSLWLIVGVIFLLYMLWGPILEASKINSKVRKYIFPALFEAYISDIYTEERVEKEQERANKLGKLELVQNKRTWLTLELEDEDGYLCKISFPFESKYNLLKIGLSVRGVVFSNRKDFTQIEAITDAWIPQARMWAGSYPFLLRPAFEEFCSLRLQK